MDVDVNVDVDEVPAHPAGLASISDLIRQEARELSEVQDVFIPVKGYEKTGLRIKYRMPESGKELDAITRKVFREVKDQFSRNLYITMDTMAYLCEGIYVMPVDIENSTEIELDPHLTGRPVGFDPTFAELIGCDDPQNATARTIIKKLFGGKDLHILNHGERLNRWLQDSKADLDTEIWQMGEF